MAAPSDTTAYTPPPLDAKIEQGIKDVTAKANDPVQTNALITIAKAAPHHGESIKVMIADLMNNAHSEEAMAQKQQGLLNVLVNAAADNYLMSGKKDNPEVISAIARLYNRNTPEDQKELTQAIHEMAAEKEKLGAEQARAELARATGVAATGAAVAPAAAAPYTPPPLDPKIEAALREKMSLLGDPKKTEALITIAKVAPDHAPDFLEKANAIASNPLKIKENLQAAHDAVAAAIVDYSVKSGGKNEEVIKAFAVLTDKTDDETKKIIAGRLQAATDARNAQTTTADAGTTGETDEEKARKAKAKKAEKDSMKELAGMLNSPGGIFMLLIMALFGGEKFLSALFGGNKKEEDGKDGKGGDTVDNKPLDLGRIESSGLRVPESVTQGGTPPGGTTGYVPPLDTPEVKIDPAKVAALAGQQAPGR